MSRLRLTLALAATAAVGLVASPAAADDPGNAIISGGACRGMSVEVQPVPNTPTRKTIVGTTAPDGCIVGSTLANGIGEGLLWGGIDAGELNAVFCGGGELMRAADLDGEVKMIVSVPGKPQLWFTGTGGVLRRFGSDAAESRTVHLVFRRLPNPSAGGATVAVTAVFRLPPNACASGTPVLVDGYVTVGDPNPQPVLDLLGL